jgi:hypothetical protein
MDLASMGVSSEAIENGIIDIIKSQGKNFDKEPTQIRCFVHFVFLDKQGLFGKTKQVEYVRLTTRYLDLVNRKNVILSKDQKLKEVTFFDQMGMISKMFKQIMESFVVGDLKKCERSEISIMFKIEAGTGKLVVAAMKNFTEQIEEISIKEIFEN